MTRQQQLAYQRKRDVDWIAHRLTRFDPDVYSLVFDRYQIKLDPEKATELQKIREGLNTAFYAHVILNGQMQPMRRRLARIIIKAVKEQIKAQKKKRK